jgi:hypothetical protein
MSKAFTDLLNKPIDDIDAPKPVPVGSWRLTIATIIVREPKDEDSPGAVLFGFKLGSPMEDVAPSALDEFGDVDEAPMVWNRFRLRDMKDAYYLKKFVETVGGETTGRTLEDASKSLEGYEVMSYIEQEPDRENPEMIWNRLTDFAAAA